MENQRHNLSEIELVEFKLETQQIKMALNTLGFKWVDKLRNGDRERLSQVIDQFYMFLTQMGL